MRGNGQRLALVAAGIAGVLALAGGTTTGDTSGSVWG